MFFDPPIPHPQKKNLKKKFKKNTFFIRWENIHQIINCRVKRIKREIVKRHKTGILTEKKIIKRARNNNTTIMTEDRKKK